MIVSACQHLERIKNGTSKSGDTRYRCKLCGKSWTEFTRAFGGMRIGMDVATRIVSLICEGNSVSATARLTNINKRTVLDVCKFVGERCQAYMRRHIKGIQVEDVQVDEIWQFIFCKRATASDLGYVGGCGDSYCFTAIERNTKLLVAWHLGRRTEYDTNEFCWKLAQATSGRFHLSSDGWTAYPMAIYNHLGDRVNYGMLVKLYREPEREDRRNTPRRG